MIKNLSPGAGRLLEGAILFGQSMVNSYSCLTISLDPSNRQVVGAEVAVAFRGPSKRYSLGWKVVKRLG